MQNLKENMGGRIKSIRDSLGMSLVHFGELLFVGKSAVHQYEKGITTPTLESLVKIAQLGGVTLDWLITGKETPKPKEEMTDDEIIAEALIRPGLQNKIFAAARNQVREEMSPYGGGVIGELVKAARQLPESDQVQLLDNAQYMIFRNESRRKEEGGSDCAETKSA